SLASSGARAVPLGVDALSSRVPRLGAGGGGTAGSRAAGFSSDGSIPEGVSVRARSARRMPGRGSSGVPAGRDGAGTRKDCRAAGVEGGGAEGQRENGADASVDGPSGRRSFSPSSRTCMSPLVCRTPASAYLGQIVRESDRYEHVDG